MQLLAEADPNELRVWSPYAIMAILTLVLPMLGGAIVWLLTNGSERWMKIQEFRRTQKSLNEKATFERLEQERKREESRRLIDKILEGKMVGEGYKGMLLIYDARVRDLERDVSELRLAHAVCREDHAKCEARCEGLETQMKTNQEMHEAKYNELRRRLDAVTQGRADPHPSPIAYSEPKKNP